MSPGSPEVCFGNMPAARLGDEAGCVGDMDVIVQGSTSLLINGLPAARVTDKTAHKGSITGPGDSTVFIGGPTFALPENFELGGDHVFQTKLIRDLYLLSTTRSGQEVFKRLAAHPDKKIWFVPTDKENGENQGSEKSGSTDNQTGSTIRYNPDYRFDAEDGQGHRIDQPPQLTLAHELVHALNNVEGTAHEDNSPGYVPPATEPGCEESEAQAIGTGSHSGDFPTENSFRDDLHLPHRDNHTSWPADAKPQLHRPGDPYRPGDHFDGGVTQGSPGP
jgi:uncharacterized Zn-binding protein involved in type VI secretion